ncbi:MAG: aspartate/glutamate racemase family protein [Gemmatimonadales bacterium]
MIENKYNVGTLDLKPSVKLLLLHPTSPDDGREGPFPSEPQGYLLPTTSVDEIYCLGAPRTIPDADACRRATPFVVEKSRWAEAQAYDAVVVNCMLDPGVHEAKRAVDIPVVGLREATRAIASLVGENPAHIFPAGLSPLALADDEERTVLELLAKGRWQTSVRGADVLIPNCAYLGGLAQRLQDELGVPVLANRHIGLRCGELLATFRLLRARAWVDATRPSRMRRLLLRVGSRIKRML